ncbi:class I SAM-dependent methyltransferase [Candidatus Pacearchaeota archaeon]|jgi:SAM-dependent methyltransferase|nr:class I SAM-dependent methyltransferase [Candidatus Pacearchaeota archaeon]
MTESERALSRTVNLGSGWEKTKGAVNVDFNPEAKPDIVHDLDVIPWPFDDGAFDTAIMYDVIEHLAKPIRAVEEAWRILTVGGLLKIRTPSFQHENSWIDLTHLHHLHRKSLDYFDPDTDIGKRYGYYTARKFKILRCAPDVHGNIEWLMEKR